MRHSPDADLLQVLQRLAANHKPGRAVFAAVDVQRDGFVVETLEVER